MANTAFRCYAVLRTWEFEIGFDISKLGSTCVGVSAADDGILPQAVLPISSPSSILTTADNTRR